MKAIVIPVALHRIIVRLNIERTVDTALGVGPTMIAGVSLVTLSILLVLPVTADVTALTREDLALALSVVLLGLLTMILRRNAIGQVVGFMSLENGLILAAVGVEGMPLIVEMLVAFAVMVAFIIFGIFFFHIRNGSTPSTCTTWKLPRGTPVIFLPVNPVHIILALAFLSAIGLAAVGPHWLATRLNSTGFQHRWWRRPAC